MHEDILSLRSITQGNKKIFFPVAWDFSTDSVYFDNADFKSEIGFPLHATVFMQFEIFDLPLCTYHRCYKNFFTFFILPQKKRFFMFFIFCVFYIWLLPLLLIYIKWLYVLCSVETIEQIIIFWTSWLYFKPIDTSQLWSLTSVDKMSRPNNGASVSIQYDSCVPRSLTFRFRVVFPY